MIDLHVEGPPLSARFAAKLPQLQRNGRSPHISQVSRWWRNGINGIVLESVVVAGTRCTTSAAVDRWIAALTEGETIEQARTPVRRAKDHSRADRELAAAGW